MESYSDQSPMRPCGRKLLPYELCQTIQTHDLSIDFENGTMIFLVNRSLVRQPLPFAAGSMAVEVSPKSAAQASNLVIP